MGKLEKPIEPARGAPQDGDAGSSSLPVNHEETPRVAAMLASSPFAIPLPARILVDNQLGVSEIPPAPLLNRYFGELDVKEDQKLPKTRHTKAPLPLGSNVRILENGTQRHEIDNTRLRHTENPGELPPGLTALERMPMTERVALIRRPRSTTNQGRSPKSRWFIRGVLHNRPIPTIAGAATTLLLMIMVPVAVMSGLLLLLSAEKPHYFSWVPRWFIAFPIALPVFGIAYLIWGVAANCRICGGRLFVHQFHRKNPRAHHVRGLGYILPLCLQILIFRWFRCTHCGTPIRLKE